MKRHVLFVALFTALMTGAVSVANASEYLVKYKSHAGLRMINTLQLQVLDDHRPGKLLKVEIPDSEVFQTITKLNSNPNIEYIVPNARVHMFTAPFDAVTLQDQYSMTKIQAMKAWDRAGNRGKRSVTVAVLDTGVDFKHKNLAPNMLPGHDFVNNTDEPMDITSSSNPGHGTHCAGVIGATGLVTGGTIGISPEVSILPIRFLDENGSGDFDTAVKAIDLAIERKADIISASWGAAISRSVAQPVIEAIARANAAGIIFVAAAANDGKDNDNYEVYPANAGLPNMIVVAASNSNDSRPYWSNYGKKMVSLSSPGDAILSTLPGDKYGNLSGTSMATPLVAGLVALVKAQDSTLDAGQIRSLLQATGAKVGIETACDCRIDAFNAIDAIVGKKMFVSPQAATFAAGSTLTFTGVYGTAPFTFTSSSPNVATIDAATGVMTGVSAGETTVTVTDAAKVTATSYKIYVDGVAATPTPIPGEPTPTPAPGQPQDPNKCPYDSPTWCAITCYWNPELPYCKTR